VNRIGEPVHLTTGRRLIEDGLPVRGDVVVLLDGQCAFKTLSDEDVDIFWGAYLGTPDEILLSGKLSELRDQIEDLRSQARQRKGWIMDTYLLRRRGAPTC
jgi:precorrin-6A synthase